VLLASFGVFLAAACFLVTQVFLSAGTRDPAEIRGNSSTAVLYSFTGAMSPLKKESARRHVPTYVGGLVFHAGVFVSFFWVAIHFLGIAANPAVSRLSGGFLIIAALVGFALFVKRIVKLKLRSFSTVDDYASNLLVVGFLATSAWALFDARFLPVSFVYASVLFLYIPLGKLRHAIFFPLARVYLGLFYGRRGVWGARKRETWETRSR
jgi:nitrate reductase gamma subunit